MRVDTISTKRWRQLKRPTNECGPLRCIVSPVKSRCCRRSSDVTEAQAHFEHAISTARQQQAKSWELRAAISMARLWRSQGKTQQAREQLAPVYGWFTEGFDTLDLKEAKMLLEELHA